MLLGGLWHGSSWNFILWGFLHGVLLITHRLLTKVKSIQIAFNHLPRAAAVIGWIVTQYFVFMTWLVFRVEDTNILTPSLKTYVGIGAHWDTMEMYEFLPDIKFVTAVVAIMFIIGHFVSWKVGGLKHWIARRGPVPWGLVIGGLLTLTFLLRPAETVDFIYFRF